MVELVDIIILYSVRNVENERQQKAVQMCRELHGLEDVLK